jgi:replicative superfamily II helicase
LVDENDDQSRVRRGGSWSNYVANCRCASRNGSSPTSATTLLGTVLVSVVCELPRSLSQSHPSHLTPRKNWKTDTNETSPTASPIDFSDIIARTNTELKRLGWTNQQGRDYLVQTYGKRSRQLLTDGELLDFLHYLESEPSPTASPIDFSDIIAKTNTELKRLGWTNQQTRDYLVQTYGKRSRQLLTDGELLDFLHYLESEPSPTASPIDFSDIIAKTNTELKRLGWTNQQTRDYLVQTYGKRSRQLLTDGELLDFLHYLESEPSPPNKVSSTPLAESPVTSFTQKELDIDTDETSSTASPIDFSDLIARTNVKMKHLGWTNQQARYYLVQTYGKRSRQLLTDAQLLDFLHYLESEPSPPD